VLVAAIHAMSIISTSGISPVGGLSGAEAGLMGEVLMALFLLLAVSVHGYSPLSGGWRLGWMRRDPQIRIMVLVVLGVPLFLLLRHLISSGPLGTWSELRAIWASMFTSLSYLTTTGFESAWWPQARAWQELSSPVLLLMALAVTGGGVATTAGGVKLLRVYALYRHATRETERMLHPNSVTRAPGSGQEDRRLRRSGAQIAWAFVVLFALALVVTALLLGLTGASFGESLVLSASALSNTGPLASASGGLPPFSRLGDSALAILGLAMGLGRIEILALISLVNPDYWRR
jgi:trk system potassium uptake protein